MHSPLKIFGAQLIHVYTCICTLQVVDEYEMVEYQAQLEQWAACEEENKHTFTISHPTQGQNSITDKVRGK